MVGLINAATIEPHSCFKVLTKMSCGMSGGYREYSPQSCRRHSSVDNYVDVDEELLLLDFRDSRLNEIMSIESCIDAKEVCGLG